MTKKIFFAAAVFAFAFGATACGKPTGGPVTTTESKGWSVLKDGKVVEWVDDKPGPMISRAAPPPPGTPMKTHPFMTATSKDIMSEGALQKIRERSSSFADYVDALKKSGYEVRPATDED